MENAGTSRKSELRSTPDRAATARERYLSYCITFACYGARLHGEESGSVDRRHNRVGSPELEPDSQRVVAERREMLQDPYVLNRASRELVLAAIRKHCALRGWNLLAAHVRSNHVHAIVESEARPERIMNEFKSRHGSTPWLWKDEDVRNALQYVIDEQGELMALFVAKEIERHPQLSAPSRSRLGIEP